MRQLACAPLISESTARAVLTHFGFSMSELRAALQNPSTFPDIPIHPSGTKLGKARVQKLADIFART